MVRPPLGEHDKMSTLGCHVPLAYRLGRHGPPQVDILSCSPNVGHHFYNITSYVKISQSELKICSAHFAIFHPHEKSIIKFTT